MRSRCSLIPIHCEIQIKVNLEMSCKEFHQSVLDMKKALAVRQDNENSNPAETLHFTYITVFVLHYIILQVIDRQRGQTGLF